MAGVGGGIGWLLQGRQEAEGINEGPGARYNLQICLPGPTSSSETTSSTVH